MYIQNNDRHKCSEDTVVSSPSLSAHSPVTFELLSKAEVEFTTTQNVSGQANANSYNFLKGSTLVRHQRAHAEHWQDDRTRTSKAKFFSFNSQFFALTIVKLHVKSPSLRMREPEIIYDYAW